MFCPAHWEESSGTRRLVHACLYIDRLHMSMYGGFFLRVNFITDNEILKAHTVARS